jgi:hypothetical protein
MLPRRSSCLSAAPIGTGKSPKGGQLQDDDVHFNGVGANYFRVMNTRLLAGRTFDSRDRPDTPRVAIVNETFVRRYFPNVDPIGETFQLDVPRIPPLSYQIVGVVRDAKFLAVREERTRAAARFSASEPTSMFLPIAHLAVSQETIPFPDYRVIVRGNGPQASLTRGPGEAAATATHWRHQDTSRNPERRNLHDLRSDERSAGSARLVLGSLVGRVVTAGQPRAARSISVG